MLTVGRSARDLLLKKWTLAAWSKKKEAQVILVWSPLLSLTPKGAVESRSIRRLTTQFSADDLVTAKGLPWSFSPQGILMKMKAPTTRRPDGVEEAEENAEEKTGDARSYGRTEHAKSLWLLHKHLFLHLEHHLDRFQIPEELLHHLVKVMAL